MSYIFKQTHFIVYVFVVLFWYVHIDYEFYNQIKLYFKMIIKLEKKQSMSQLIYCKSTYCNN